MPQFFEDSKILTSTVRINPDSHSRFVDWQAQLNSIITGFPGFISLEILSQEESNWVFTQRFNNQETMLGWKNSSQRHQLLDSLKPLLVQNTSIQESESNASDLKEGVTEVIITDVDPLTAQHYKQWMSKIHQVEAKFKGFRGVYVQSPEEGQGKHWITLLQFDSPANLDAWLNSAERQSVLSESKTMITSLESHRVISPFAGWFSSIARTGQAPPLWKQTMIILLVLFPIVMLELKYLSPLTAPLNSSLATFIGNAISVCLISWPMMPLAIKCLGWWLSPKPFHSRSINIYGTLFILLLYLIEIVAMWNLLSK